MSSLSLPSCKRGTDWTKLLNGLSLGSCPALSQILRPLEPEYYWSADETEWATDIMFKSVATLEELFESFVHHAMRVCDSLSVMKYWVGVALQAMPLMRLSATIEDAMKVYGSSTV